MCDIKLRVWCEGIAWTVGQLDSVPLYLQNV